MIEALISAAAAIIVCLINNATQMKKIRKGNEENAAMIRKGNEENAALISYRIEQLEKKTQAHNNLIERMYHVEERMEVHEEKIKVANHRIDDLEKERS
jgi:predicted membrane protein